MTVSGVEAQLFRHVLGHLPTGACVVTTIGPSRQPLGLSCNSFTSVSLSPPLVAFCPAKSSTTWPLMRPSHSFAVNVLSERQHDMCRQFSHRGVDRFAGVEWHESSRGNPLLEGALAWLDCEMVDEHDAGDHTIVVAAVHELDSPGTVGPLVVFRGRYGRLLIEG